MRFIIEFISNINVVLYDPKSDLKIFKNYEIGSHKIDDGVTYEAIMAKYTVSQKASENMDKDAMASQKDLDEIHTMVYCKPLKFNWFLFFLYYLLAVCSFGLLLLLSRWFVWLRDRMTHLECSNAEADIVFIKVCFRKLFKMANNSKLSPIITIEQYWSIDNL